jgi:enterochelin esterase family protein
VIVPVEPVATVGAGAWAGDATMTLRLADPDHVLAGVRLQQDLGIAADLLDFRRASGGWELTLDRPPVARVEYLLELHGQDGRTQVVPDPANPRQAAGAFGPKSVLEFPGYAAPAWLAAAADPGSSITLAVPASSLDDAVVVRIWAPSDAPGDEPLPLLVVHDGPEYDSLASLTQYLGAGIAGGWLPRLRAALLSPGQVGPGQLGSGQPGPEQPGPEQLSPGHRNDWYSASAGYARALMTQVIPAVTGGVASTVRIGMGTSLGGLAMLHAHCRYPGVFGGLFLQSGSFFVPRLDSQERRFRYYRRITAFTAAVRAHRVPGAPVPVVMTCGSIEENIGNNRLMLAVLRSAGYPATLHEVADVHNYTAWRDAFDPYLTELVAAVTR